MRIGIEDYRVAGSNDPRRISYLLRAAYPTRRAFLGATERLQESQMSDWVEEGERLDFTLAADDGRQVKLSDLRGKPVVLYFLSEGRHARLHQGGARSATARRELPGQGAMVLGGLPDDVASHGKFRGTSTASTPPRRRRPPGGRALWRLAGEDPRWRPARSTFVIDGDGKSARRGRRSTSTATTSRCSTPQAPCLSHGRSRAGAVGVTLPAHPSSRIPPSGRLRALAFPSPAGACATPLRSDPCSGFLPRMYAIDVFQQVMEMGHEQVLFCNPEVGLGDHRRPLDRARPPAAASGCGRTPAPRRRWSTCSASRAA